MVKIYSLEDPRDNKVRYIGQTKHLLELRLEQHIKHCNKNNHKENWIKSLLKQGLKPTINLVEEVEKLDWRWNEKYWISQFRAWGFNLTNITGGGDWGDTWTYLTDEQKQDRSKKLSDGVKNSEKHKRAMKSEENKERRKLRKTTNETRKKQSIAKLGKAFSKSHCENISKTRKRLFKEGKLVNSFEKHTEETKIHLSEKAKNREKNQCEHCHALVDLSNYARWHGDNCKHNPNITQESIDRRNNNNKSFKRTKEWKIQQQKETNKNQ